MCFARSFERRWAALWKGRRSAGSCGMKSLRQSSTTAAACRLIATQGASITPHLTLGDGTWPGLSAARPLSYSSRPHSRIASASSDSSSLGYLASSAAFFSAAALSAAAFSAAAASAAAFSFFSGESLRLREIAIFSPAAATFSPIPFFFSPSFSPSFFSSPPSSFFSPPSSPSFPSPSLPPSVLAASGAGAGAGSGGGAGAGAGAGGGFGFLGGHLMLAAFS
mmetsp:Transcript_1271/g.3416  ORF Transcript_1271/g.3416 Transcript_1271/m.3416 type:complete len:223 (+) Transcript_1271:353-1021(+)